MKPTLLSEFPQMLKENYCYMSQGVITVMRVARQYDNRIKFLQRVDERLSINHYQQRIYELKGELRYLVCFIALPLAKEERDQGWLFVEDGKQFLNKLDISRLKQGAFEKAEKIYRLQALKRLLNSNTCLEQTVKILEVPDAISAG